MATILSYLTKATLFKQNATVIEKGTDEKGSFIITDTTPAYPQGGGQESDNGFFISDAGQFKFKDVRLYDGIVKHYLMEGWQHLSEGSLVEINIEENRRKRNSLLHTAGHLIASVAFQIIPKVTPVKGHHFSDGSYIELRGESEVNIEEVKSNLQNILNEEIKTEKNVSSEIVTVEEFKLRCPFVQPGIPTDKPLRVVTIETFFPMGCGGTHIEKLNEIPALTITKLKFSKGFMKINYSCSK